MCFQPRSFRGIFLCTPFQGKNLLISLFLGGSEHTLDPFVLHLTDPCACKTRHPLFRTVPSSSPFQRFWGWDPADTYSQYMGFSLEIQNHVSSHFSSGSSDKSYSASSHGQDRNAFFRGRWWAWQTTSSCTTRDMGWTNPRLAEQGASKQKAVHILPVIFWWVNSDGLASALHCSLGSVSHLQPGDTFSALALDHTFLSFPWAVL